MSYWLPPEVVDPEKLKPRRLDPDQYDTMRTALDSINKMARELEPEKLKELVGAITLTPSEDIQSGKINLPIYRTQPDGDHLACHDCKDRGDQWYMQDHHCRRSKIEKLPLQPRIKLSQRKAEHIKRLQRENGRIG